MIWIILYIAVASVAIFGLLVAADYVDVLEDRWGDLCLIRYIVCGIFWPVCLLPAAAYLAALYYISARKEN